MNTIDVEYADLGIELFVLWGDPGTPQKKIRAVVSPFPHLDLTPNSQYDVETIPHPGLGKDISGS